MRGGHGELFVQQFDGRTARTDERAVSTCRRRGAAEAIDAPTGRRHRRRGAGRGARHRARRLTRWPSAAQCAALARSRCASLAPQADLRPRARRPRRRRRHDGDAPHRAAERPARARQRRATSMRSCEVMNAAFDDRFGEAWTRSQCAGILPMPGVSPDRRRSAMGDAPASRCSGRSPTKPSCCCSRSIPRAQRRGHRPALLDHFIDHARDARRRTRSPRSARRQSGGRPCIGLPGFSPPAAATTIITAATAAIRRADTDAARL